MFVPADLEPAKIEHALAYGATVVRVDGTYDDVNRLCLEVADELPWGLVNVNLRPFYAEGSKTLGYEIAEDLGWRLPDVIVAPIASGAMITRLARGFEELVELGWVAPKAVRFVGGQAAGCSPVATAFAAGRSDIEPVRTPDTIVRSLAIGNPADGRYAIELARASGGSIEAVTDEQTADAIRRTAALEGVYTETAGGVTIAAAEAARRNGTIRDGDEVVALLTGNGLKTPDAVQFGMETAARRARPAGPHAGHPGAARRVRSLAVGMSQVRIPPVLRTSAGGQKLVEVEGATVGEALGALVAAYPDLGPRLLDETGRHQPLRERVRERDRRPPPAGPRDPGQPDGYGAAAAGDGRGLTLRHREQRRERVRGQRPRVRDQPVRVREVVADADGDHPRRLDREDPGPRVLDPDAVLEPDAEPLRRHQEDLRVRLALDERRRVHDGVHGLLDAQVPHDVVDVLAHRRDRGADAACPQLDEQLPDPRQEVVRADLVDELPEVGVLAVREARLSATLAVWPAFSRMMSRLSIRLTPLSRSLSSRSKGRDASAARRCQAA